MIIKLENFCNELGMLIQQRTIVSGSGKHPKFVGTVGVKIEKADDPNAMQTIEFAIEVDTIEEAFDNFKKYADVKINKIRKEQEEAVEKEFAKPIDIPELDAPKPAKKGEVSKIAVVKKRKGLILP